WQFRQEVGIDTFDAVLAVDVVVETEPDVPASAAIGCVEAKTCRVAVVSNGSVIGRRRQIEQMLDTRINRTASQRQKINSLELVVVRPKVSEIAEPGSRQQHGTIGRKVLRGVGV